MTSPRLALRCRVAFARARANRCAGLGREGIGLSPVWTRGRGRNRGDRRLYGLDRFRCDQAVGATERSLSCLAQTFTAPGFSQPQCTTTKRFAPKLDARLACPHKRARADLALSCSCGSVRGHRRHRRIRRARARKRRQRLHAAAARRCEEWAQDGGFGRSGGAGECRQRCFAGRSGGSIVGDRARRCNRVPILAGTPGNLTPASREGSEPCVGNSR